MPMVEVTVYPRIDEIQPLPYTTGHDPLAGYVPPRENVTSNPELARRYPLARRRGPPNSAPEAIAQAARIGSTIRHASSVATATSMRVLPCWRMRR